MNDDSDPSRNSLVGALGGYGELYPSLRRRLREAETSAKPEIRARMKALKDVLARREADRLDRLRARYGLTPTEARLAMHLADGGGVAGYAEGAGVSVGTARNQLKAVFAKTGVNRQAALAALVRNPGL